MKVGVGIRVSVSKANQNGPVERILEMWIVQSIRGMEDENRTARLPLERSLCASCWDIYTERPFQSWRLIDKRDIDDPLAEITPCLYKSSDWSYEREWRTFLPSKGEGTLIVPAQDCISGIFFGLKGYFDERNEIETWARSNNVTVYQMERSYCSYDFVYDRVDDLRQGKQRKGLLL